MSRSEAVNATEQRIKEIAYNVAVALRTELAWARSQGAACHRQSKEIGVKYLRYLLEDGIDAAPGHLPAGYA